MPAKTRMPKPLNVPGERMLRRREVEAKIGYGRSTIYKLVAAGDFPKPVRTGPNAVRWRLSQIEAWMNEKPENVSETSPKAGAECGSRYLPKQSSACSSTSSGDGEMLSKSNDAELAEDEDAAWVKIFRDLGFDGEGKRL